MIKGFLTKWYVWATLFVIALIVAVGMVKVDVERRDYMTQEEYENISKGMTFDAFLKVQEAKPSHDAQYLGDNTYRLDYWGDKDKTTEVRIYLQGTNKETQIVIKKDIAKLP